MLLTELFEHKEKEFKLDYLVEYLVVTDSLLPKESKQLITLVEKMHQDTEKQIASTFQKKMAELVERYNTAIKNARQEVVAAKQAGKSPKIIQALLVKIDNLKQSFSMAKNNLLQRFKNMKAANIKKMADTKALVSVKPTSPAPGGAKVASKLGTKGKVGLAAAGTLAAVGGYAAYRARKRKQVASA